MSSLLLKHSSKHALRSVISSHSKYHVAITGCVNPIAQATALLLRNEPTVTKISLHDVQAQTAGVIFDLYNIPAFSTLKGYYGVNALDKALHKADIVIAVGTAIIQRQGVSHCSIVNSNATHLRVLASKLANMTPQPILGIAVEPINMILPYTVEMLKEYGNYNRKLVYGITMNDILTAQALLASEKGMDLGKHLVPVIGGHSPRTIVPLLSHVQDVLNLPDKYVEEVTQKIRRASEIVVLGKQGIPPILCVANGIATFVRNIIRAMEGHKVRSCAYIESNYFGTEFFSGPITIDENCVPELQTYQKFSVRECDLLEKAIGNLREDVRKGRELHYKSNVKQRQAVEI